MIMTTPETDESFGTIEHERDVAVLAHLHESRTSDAQHVSQRSIAKALGMSVGLTNAILKRLVEKGFVMVKRINHNNAHYLVTPQGIQQIGKRSYFYLRRTIGHVVRYKEVLLAFCREQAAKGVREIMLVGQSDLAFLLEWCAEKEGLWFTRAETHRGDQPIEHGTVVILAESHGYLANCSALSLHQTILGLGADCEI